LYSSLYRPSPGLHISNDFVRAFLINRHGRIRRENRKAALRAAAARTADRTKGIIRQCIPVCKARLLRCAATYSIGSIAVVGMARPAVLDLVQKKLFG
jgi:hypothetical protein